MLVVLLLVTLGTATGGKYIGQSRPGAAERSEVTAFTCIPTHCLTINLITSCIFFSLLVLLVLYGVCMLVSYSC